MSTKTVDEKFLLQKREIGFTKDGITISNLIPKTSSWSEIDNVVLKGGILTIDYKNNKLIQLETDDEEDDEYEYCFEDQASIYLDEDQASIDLDEEEKEEKGQRDSI